MKLTGKISILINQDKTTIEIRDANANVKFASITLTPEQLSAALSRLSNVTCEIEVAGLEKVGKKHEVDSFEFEIPKKLYSSSNEDELHKLAQSLLSDGWEADKYFGSHNSFFTRNNVHHARCTIRRWV